MAVVPLRKYLDAQTMRPVLEAGRVEVLGTGVRSKRDELEAMYRGEREMKFSEVQVEGEVELCERLKRKSVALARERQRRQVRVAALAEMKRSSAVLAMTSRQSELESEKDVALYLDLQERMVDRLSEDRREPEKVEEKVPHRASKAVAFTRQSLDREAGAIVKEFKARCTANVAEYRQQMKELEDSEELLFLDGHYRKRRTPKQLWLKTRFALPMATSMSKKRTEDVQEKNKFFDEYHRILHGSRIDSLVMTTEQEGIEGDTAFDGLSPRCDATTKRAREALIIGCVKQGIAPEPLVKATALPAASKRRASYGDAASTSVQPTSHQAVLDLHLAYYGIGDVRGTALADALPAMAPRLRTLDLTRNRLSAVAVALILEKMVLFKRKQRPALLILMLSQNYDALKSLDAANALANVIKYAPDLEILSLSNVGLGTTTLNPVVESLQHDSPKQALRRLDLSSNGLDARAGVVLAAYVADTDCGLRSLSLAWNSLRGAGVAALGKALASNTNLESLDLSYNALRDDEVEPLAFGVAKNHSLKRLILSWNRVTARAAMVFAHTLSSYEIACSDPRQEPTALEFLDLSGNPIGRTGARAVFRRRLLGLSTTVGLQNCSLGGVAASKKKKTDAAPTTAAEFDVDMVAADSPFDLDLAKSHDKAVASEIARAAWIDRGRLIIESSSRRTAVVCSDETLVIEGQSTPYAFPATGRYRISYRPSKSGSLLRNRRPMAKSVFENLVKVLAETKSRTERSAVLGMLARDVYASTEQVKRIVDELARMHGATDFDTEPTEPSELVSAFWPRIVDESSKLDLIFEAATKVSSMTASEEDQLQNEERMELMKKQNLPRPPVPTSCFDPSLDFIFHFRTVGVVRSKL